MLAQNKLRKIENSDFENEILPNKLSVLEGFFPAVVVGGTSKKYPGYVKVKIYGITEDLPNMDQPWAEPAPETMFRVPRKGTAVLVYFKNGDIHFPVYTNQSIDARGSYLPKDDYAEDYPNTIVLFSSQNGTKVVHNNEEDTLSINHQSGVTITINSFGIIEITNVYLGNAVPVLTEMTPCPITGLHGGGGTVAFKVPDIRAGIPLGT